MGKTQLLECSMFHTSRQIFSLLGVSVLELLLRLEGKLSRRVIDFLHFPIVPRLPVGFPSRPLAGAPPGLLLLCFHITTRLALLRAAVHPR